MTLDFWLVARLAKELAAVLTGARIQSLAATGAGIIFYCYRRGDHVALQISVDSNAPLVAAYALPDVQKENGTEGWAGGVAALLRGAIIDDVQAVPNDRVLYVDLSSRSAFGVPSHSRIVIELQPRKANALVLRPGDDGQWIIVAAAKQFDGSHEARSVKTGERYVAPPPRRALLDRAQFILAARELDARDADRFVRLLSEFDPDCTPLLARESVFRTAASRAGALSPRTVLDEWAALRREVENALEDSRDIFVVRPPGKQFICHLVPLTFAVAGASPNSIGQAPTPVKTVNELCASAFAEQQAPRSGPAPDVLRKKLATMLARCAEESAGLESARQRAAQADHLREAGDAIYAHLTEIAAGVDGFNTPDGRRISLDPLLTPKGNASEYFRQYKKARSGLPRIEARLRVLRANREYWEHLQWEIERAQLLPTAESEPLLAEIADALGVKEQRKHKRRPRAGERRVALSAGAVALIGRSPKENERLTFSVAGPNDYWFHARAVPGAHVIVKTDGAEISLQQIEEAAALAAGHSRAFRSANVEVDYTQRKHVRRQAAGRPGLVWYTDFSTVRVAPKSEGG